MKWAQKRVIEDYMHTTLRSKFAEGLTVKEAGILVQQALGCKGSVPFLRLTCQRLKIERKNAHKTKSADAIQILAKILAAHLTKHNEIIPDELTDLLQLVEIEPEETEETEEPMLAPVQQLRPDVPGQVVVQELEKYWN